jgi:hypothetical protein
LQKRSVGSAIIPRADPGSNNEHIYPRDEYLRGDPGVVSRNIKALETELGVLLFVRSTRSLKLTKEGARFYRDCVQIVKRFEDATRQFRTEASQRSQQGRVSAGNVATDVAPQNSGIRTTIPRDGNHSG